MEKKRKRQFQRIHSVSNIQGEWNQRNAGFGFTMMGPFELETSCVPLSNKQNYELLNGNHRQAERLCSSRSNLAGRRCAYVKPAASDENVMHTQKDNADRADQRQGPVTRKLSGRIPGQAIGSGTRLGKELFNDFPVVGAVLEDPEAVRASELGNPWEFRSVSIGLTDAPPRELSKFQANLSLWLLYPQGAKWECTHNFYRLNAGFDLCCSVRHQKPSLLDLRPKPEHH
ncbi:hypothetical protein B0H14DRAFT_2586571 [Mycena olivaceomarginata]|nr:hypothetical protein B0H14DRAFT_2586571 [Mycena olivaceomarginata]